MDLEALGYPLSADRIATDPAEPRDAARLMLVERSTGAVTHGRVRDLAGPDSPLRPGDLMVFNETRVVAARFEGRRKATGGRVKGLYVRSDVECEGWEVMLEARGALKPGEIIVLDDDLPARLELVERLASGRWRARRDGPLDTLALLERIGTTPLPPYICDERRRQGRDPVEASDARSYNTVFAREHGSVAAPTASLHFTPALLEAIRDMGIRHARLSLHVGPGTFLPIRSARVEDHDMHEERIRVPLETIRALDDARRSGVRIVPVGTTCVRALESLPDPLPERDYEAATGLFIRPGDDGSPFGFRFADALMTNFHLPHSTLLALVAALPGVGIDRLKRWYEIAIEHEYRFYSYCDAMLIM